MKILNLTEFRALPPDTVFQKYEPCIFGPLQIKGETLSHDFFAEDVAGEVTCIGPYQTHEVLGNARAHSISVPMDFGVQSRDACFEDGQLFAVWEPADVKALVERLNRCIK